MYIVLEQLLDFIFPPSVEKRCVRAITARELGLLYVYRHQEDVHTLSLYKDEHIRALIHEAKFHRNQHACKLLGTMLEKYLKARDIPYLILPIPLSKKRLRSRGYNQVEEIIRTCALPAQMNLHTNVLVRKKHTRPQTELQRAERLVNLRDAFGVANEKVIHGKHILIIDDVTTTGTTLRTAKATLLPYGPASVTCVALAH